MSGHASCTVCDGGFSEFHSTREMMFGLREPFTYGECGTCASLTLVDPPEDMSRYYPEDYYSLEAARRPGRVVRFAKRIRAEAAVRGFSRVADLIGHSAAPLEWPTWLAVTGLDRSASVLDVGSGTGEMLLSLRDQGFRDLRGVDPYVGDDTFRGGVPIRKGSIEDIDERFDLVMLNHSFEHVPDPRVTLRSLRRVVALRGALMLRVPVAGCWAWRHYGSDWVSLDAPRHLFIPSPDGMEKLAAETGFEVFATVYDSRHWQFWRSEQYQRDVGLFEDDSFQVSADAPHAPAPSQVREMEGRARRLNESEDGDTAAFFLRPAAAS